MGVKRLTKEQKFSLILPSIMAMSAVLVGISLFDRNYKLDTVGYIAGIIGFIPLAVFACISLILIACNTTKMIKNEEHKNQSSLSDCVNTFSLIASTLLVGIGLFDRGNKLGDIGFIAGSIGFAYISCFVLSNIYSTVKDVLRGYINLPPSDNLQGTQASKPVHLSM